MTFQGFADLFKIYYLFYLISTLLLYTYVCQLIVDYENGYFSNTKQYNKVFDLHLLILGNRIG